MICSPLFPKMNLIDLFIKFSKFRHQTDVFLPLLNFILSSTYIKPGMKDMAKLLTCCDLECTDRIK